MSRKRLIIAVAVAGGVALFFGVFGVQLVFAVSWGILAGALVVIGQLALNDEETDPPVDDTPLRRGSEVSRMAWAFNPRTGAAGELVTRRVRSILIRRLGRHGLDPEDPAQRPAVDALLGGDLWDRLTGRRSTRADLEQALDIIDRLATRPEEK